MEVSFISACLLLFLVVDPLGNIPMFTTALSYVEPQRRTRIILRECMIALIIFLVFTFFGKYLLELLHLSEPSLSISGGIVLFMIALRMIFQREGTSIIGDDIKEEPFIVPLAVPLLAGPSSLATIMLLVSSQPGKLWYWVAAVFVVLALAAFILSMGNHIASFLGRKGMRAMERLMGLVLTAIAVQMFLNGVRAFLLEMRALPPV